MCAKKIFKTVVIASALSLSNSVFAAASWVPNAKITNLTSIPSGLLIRVNNSEVPDNCTSGKLWMLVEQENTAMISVTLTAWTLGKNVTVYTRATNNGYCTIGQIDPIE